jgi:hypothetical protein
MSLVPSVNFPARRAPRRRPRRQRVAGWQRLIAGARWLGRATARGALLWHRAALAPKLIAAAIVLVGLWAVVNITYHVAKKPTELFFPVSGVLKKPPLETWQEYGPLFRHYATPLIAPELLAALAQVESAGDPVARTYWRWRFSWNPLALYQPASSAVGMYQMTDPAFAEARRYCVRDHAVVAEGPWSCWLNPLYTRVIPSHAVELTAIYLDRKVAGLLEHAPRPATAPQKQNLAALVHLCGAGPAESYLRHGFHLAAGERCGDHEAAFYLARVNAAAQQFHRFADAE